MPPHQLLDPLEQELDCVKTVNLQEMLVWLENFAVLELVLLVGEIVLEKQGKHVRISLFNNIFIHLLNKITLKNKTIFHLKRKGDITQ